MCKTLIYNTETNLVASLYVDAPHVVVKSRQHDTSQYASLTTNTNPSRPPFRRRLKIEIHKHSLSLVCGGGSTWSQTGDLYGVPPPKEH